MGKTYRQDKEELNGYRDYRTVKNKKNFKRDAAYQVKRRERSKERTSYLDERIVDDGE